ncbi:3-isopropylmalate dehydratase large subunit [Methylobacterium aquaticum]|jgi:3-isopropylmalate/(R)-2-methylmalate dehydratase large subunit|uniref:3-isopropylmalate dehydratase large subunit n=1 Tax=Methylobacterium aquaticum TaxID=270351 RepID=A0A0J6SEW7_9HYPH|nr:3-isopropylmalate dehydratase large subunit [Methylobacterium aquaticum]KMO32232.1 3-isopropylmalate dehydratase [Methylobacterium aquaticum]
MAATPQAARTLFAKIWDEHVVSDLGDGAVLLHVDRHLLHDLGGSRGLLDLKQRGLSVHSPHLTFATPDHAISSAAGRAGTTETGWNLLRALRAETRDAGIRLFDVGERGQGIVHVIGPELGLSLPGTLIVCGDSHTCTHGGLGALAFGIGSSELSHVLATQTLVQRRPKTMRVRFEGATAPGVLPKDLILHLIGVIGAAGGTGYAVEYGGSAIRAMPVEGRLTICNLSIELGAKIGMVAPDDTTFAYLQGKPYAPRGEAWDRAVAAWRELASDADAVFDREVVIDVALVAPQVTWGTSPEHVVPVDGLIPDPAAEPDPTRARAMAAALDYMGLSPGGPIVGTPVDWVFIGSCTNGRLSDLREAADVARGGRVADGVRAWVVPGSEIVKREAEAEGLDRVFVEAGFEWREPGCSMCLAANGEVVPAGQRSVSTSNRNFVGRQGPRARTHLASPAMAAAAALAGAIADVRRDG